MSNTRCRDCRRTHVPIAGARCGRCVAAAVPLHRRVTRPRGISVTDAALALRRESSATVDAMLAAAKAARLAEEKRSGHRRFTIDDGWAQRPGHSTGDGELRIAAVQP